MTAGFTARHEGQHEGGCVSCQLVAAREEAATLRELLRQIVTGELEVIHHEIVDGKLKLLVAPPGSFQIDAGGDPIRLEDIYDAGWRPPHDVPVFEEGQP